MNTWMDTQEKVFAYIREHHMLQAGDRVVAGVSGGADSVCLLFLLLEWQKEVPTDIAVVHVDHGIRAEAGEDARYVEQLCEERGIPFFLTRAEPRRSQWPTTAMTAARPSCSICSGAVESGDWPAFCL